MPDPEHPGFPIFKGLQKPMEFMGLQGRYIYWAAITFGVAILGLFIINPFLGWIPSLVFCVITAVFGIGKILICQRKGLHTKKEDKGIYVYARSRQL